MATAPVHARPQSDGPADSWARPGAVHTPRAPKAAELHPRAWTIQHLRLLNIEAHNIKPSPIPPSSYAPRHTAVLSTPVDVQIRNDYEDGINIIRQNLTRIPLLGIILHEIIVYLEAPFGLGWKGWPKLTADWNGLTVRWKPWMVLGRRVVLVGGEQWRKTEKVVGALFAFANGQKLDGRFWVVVMRDVWGIVATVDGSARDFREGKPAEEGPMIVEVSKWKLGNKEECLIWLENVARVFELAKSEDERRR